jgi:hypothetical protein
MDKHVIESGRSAALLDFRGAWFSVAAALMAGMTATWALSAMGFLVGMPVARWQSICGASTALIFLYHLGDDWRDRVLRSVMLVLVVFLAVAIAAVTVDDGYDGWLYHQAGVIGLAHAWNPVAEPLFHVWWSAHGAALGSAPGAPYVDGLWTTAYPKAAWILASHAVVWGLPLDSGKYAEILLIFVAGGVALRALRLGGLSASWSVGLAVVAALSPVSVMQATTYYVDGALGSCLTVLLFSLLAFNITRSRLDLFLAAAAALMACNLKFTGPIYVASIVLPGLVWSLWKEQLAVRHFPIIGSAALLLILCSVNPYLTNVRIGGSPIQPLNRKDVMLDQMWPEFLAKNRFEKLVISLTFTNYLNPYGELPESVLRKITNPFQLRSIREFREFATSYDLRIGGFGPLFGVALALALLIALLRARDEAKDVGFALIMLGTVASILGNPELWWARYVPQMWLLPVLAIACAVRARANRRMALVIACAMGVTSLIAVVGRTASAALTTMTYQDNLRKAGTGPLLVNVSMNEGFFLPVLAYRLHERGAHFQISQAWCSDPIQVIQIKVCLSAPNE